MLGVFVGENEAYRQTFRRAKSILLIGSCLEKFHASSDIYFGLFRLMFAAHLDCRVSVQGLSYSSDTFCTVLKISKDSSVTVPEVLPVIFRLVKLNIQFEIAARTSENAAAHTAANEATAHTCEHSPPASLPNRSAYTAAQRRLSASELSDMNCTTVQGVFHLYDEIMLFRGLCMGDEVVETLVSLIFLVDDHTLREGEEGSGGISFRSSVFCTFVPVKPVN